MSAYVPGLAWLVALLAVNAFFVGAEFAVISARRSQIEPRVAAGSSAARTALWAMEHATLMLATSQLGITVASLVILNVSEPAIHHLLEYPLSATGIAPETVTRVAFIVALVVVTFLHVVFGEMMPKNIAFSVPDRAVLLLAPPLVMVSRVVSPVIRLLNWLANGVLRLCGVQPKDEATSAYTIDQVAVIVAQSTREGTLQDASGTVAGALKFTARTARDVAVALDQLVMLPTGVTPRDVQQEVARSGYSRYPVADPTPGPSRYLHVKDVLDLTDPQSLDSPVPDDRWRALPVISASAALEDALATFRRSAAHLALVADDDASSGYTGMLFLEDMVEELVGEIQDGTR